MPLLVTTVVVFTTTLVLVATAQTSSSATVSYSDFRGQTFSPLASQIAYELTPCGCTSSNPVPTFTFSGVTSSVMTYTMLNTASKSLLEYMAGLMEACSCTQGETLATEALSATPEPSSVDKITTSDVDTFTKSIANSISSLLNACCNPQVSTRQYSFIDGTFTYEEAVADATKRGGTVATIASRNDCMRVSSILRSLSPQSTAVSTPAGNLMFAWLGLKRTNTAWQWASGATYAFSNWGYQQPSVSNDCAAFTITDSAGIWSTWASLSCTTVRLPYVLELPAATSGGSGSETIIIVAIIVVLVVVFIIATIFILLKRFVPAFRGRAGVAGGRRATPEERERREAAHRRRERRRSRARTGPGNNEEEDDEMDPVAPDAADGETVGASEHAGSVSTAAAPVARHRKAESPEERGADLEDSGAHREAQRSLRHSRRHAETGGLAPPRDGPQQVTRRRPEATPNSTPNSALTSPVMTSSAAPTAAVPTARRRSAPSTNSALPATRGSIAVPPPTASQASPESLSAAQAIQQQRIIRARMIREQQRQLLMQAAAENNNTGTVSPQAASSPVALESDHTPRRASQSHDFSDVEPMEEMPSPSAFAAAGQDGYEADGMSRRTTTNESNS